MTGKRTTTRRTAIRSSIGLVSAAGLAGCSGFLGFGGSGGSGLQPGDTVESQLSTDAPRDPVYDDLADPYTISLESQTTVALTMRSQTFDTYLLVTQNGSMVVEDDDGGTGVNSRLVATLDPGTYTVWAGSFSGTDTGSYTLTVDEAGGTGGGSSGGTGESGDGGGSGGGAASAEPLPLGSSVQGQISTGAPTDPAREGLASPHNLTLDSGTTVRISLQSQAFDTYLVVTQNGSTVAEDDDGGSGFNSRITTTLDAGTYTVWAGSYGGSATGTYSLGATDVASGGSGGSVSPEPIELGSLVRDELTMNAPEDPVHGGIADPYRLSLESTTEVSISLQSQDFDTYLVVTRDGNYVGEDDDGGEAEFNSRLVTTLEAGTYTIWAGSFSGSATGAYVLTVEQA